MEITTKKYYPKPSKKKLMMLCSRCGSSIQIRRPYAVGAECGSCGNNQFNHVVI